MKICLDLGATEIKAAPVDNGKLLGNVAKIPTCADMGKDGILCALRKAVQTFLRDDVKSVAVASAGNIDSDRKLITYATENLPGMTGFDFADFFLKNFGLPCTVLNDAHAALLGEMYFGSGRRFFGKCVVMLTLGSGVGGAYFRDGRIVSNEANDFCRFGHICLVPNGAKCTCGKLGCAEMYLSGRALHKRAAQLGVDSPDVFAKASVGEERCALFVHDFRQNLRQTLQKTEKICPFDVCIIGGGVTNWLGESFEQATADLGYDIVRAELGNEAGVFGAYVFSEM